MDRSPNIDRMVRCLHKISHDTYTVQKVIKGGSLGKGTATEDSDIDLVVYFNGLHSIQDLERKRPVLLDLIEAEVRRNDWPGGITLKKKTSRSISYTVCGTDIDILPAFDAEGELGGASAVYEAMRHYPGTSGQAAQEYSASLATKQIEFVKKADSRVKEAIRMLKEWKEENDLDINSYSLELLAIHVHKPGMSREQVFTKCMGQLAACNNLRVTFNEYYKSRDYVSKQNPPYILDPVNPLNNTLHGVDTRAVSRAANAYFRNH